MALIDDLLFEVGRRVVLFSTTTTMPDGSQLGFDGDPNTAGTSTPGETLIYNCPLGTRFQQSDGTQWYKKMAPNVWELFGAGGEEKWIDDPTDPNAVRLDGDKEINIYRDINLIPSLVSILNENLDSFIYTDGGIGNRYTEGLRLDVATLNSTTRDSVKAIVQKIINSGISDWSSTFDDINEMWYSYYDLTWDDLTSTGIEFTIRVNSTDYRFLFQGIDYSKSGSDYYLYLYGIAFDELNQVVSFNETFINVELFELGPYPKINPYDSKFNNISQFVWDASTYADFDDFVTNLRVETFVELYPDALVDVKISGVGHIITTNTYDNIFKKCRFIGDSNENHMITIGETTLSAPNTLDGVILNMTNTSAYSITIPKTSPIATPLYMKNRAELRCPTGSNGISIQAGSFKGDNNGILDLYLDSFSKITEVADGMLIYGISGGPGARLNLYLLGGSEINTDRLYNSISMYIYYTSDIVETGNFANTSNIPTKNRLSDSNFTKNNKVFVFPSYGITFYDFFRLHNLDYLDYPYTILLSNTDTINIGNEFVLERYGNMHQCTIVGNLSYNEKSIININTGTEFIGGKLPNFENCDINFNSSSVVAQLNGLNNDWVLKNCTVKNIFGGLTPPFSIGNTGVNTHIYLDNTQFIYYNNYPLFRNQSNNKLTKFFMHNNSSVDNLFISSVIGAEITAYLDSSSEISDQDVNTTVNRIFVDKAINQFYDNTTSQLESTNVNDAIDEVYNKRFKRVNVDSWPFAYVNFPFTIGISPKLKWFPRVDQYYGKFLFEIYQTGFGIMGTDLNFNDYTELESWVNTNLSSTNGIVIYCYYYEDQRVGTTNCLKGINFAYSLLKAGKYRKSFKTLGQSYYDVKWSGIDLFIKDIYNVFFGIDATSDHQGYARGIWFSSNFEKIYNHYRDNLTPPAYIQMFPDTNDRYLFDSGGTLYDIATVQPDKMEIIDSKFYAFSKSYPATFSLVDRVTYNNFYNFISQDSIIKIYVLRDNLSGHYAFLIKPVGVDNFYINGSSDDNGIGLVAISEGTRQTKYKWLTVIDDIGDTGEYRQNEILHTFNKTSELITSLIGKDNSHTSIKKMNSSLNKLRLMIDYGNGIFSKPTNSIKLLVKKPGVPIQIQII